MPPCKLSVVAESTLWSTHSWVDQIRRMMILDKERRRPALVGAIDTEIMTQRLTPAASRPLRTPASGLDGLRRIDLAIALDALSFDMSRETWSGSVSPASS
jgi:hypothetical protein